MTILRTAAISSTLLALAACGQPSSAPGLSGADRDAFVNSAISSCEAAGSGAGVSAQAMSEYCKCSSNALADKISPAEAQTLAAESNDAKVQATLASRAQEAAQACITKLRGG